MDEQPKRGDVIRINVSLYVEIVDPDALVAGIRSRLAKHSPQALDAYPEDDVIGAIVGQYNASAMVEHLDGLRALSSEARFTIVPESEAHQHR